MTIENNERNDVFLQTVATILLRYSFWSGILAIVVHLIFDCSWLDVPR